MVFVSLVLLIGGSILLYRQYRFVPVRFPDGDMITTPVQEGSEEQPKASDSVTITIAGAPNDTGNVKIAVFDSKESFNQPDLASSLATARIAEGVAGLLIAAEDLPERFAIAAFHDENDDGEMNRNRWGIPTERYGFSRNARGLAGPPSYEQVVIERPAPGEVITIFIR